MKIRWIITATLVAVLAHDTIGGRNIFAASAPLKAIFTFGGLNERSGILWVARDAGIFQKHGIDPTIVNVRNAQVGMSALAGGETQFHVGSATGTSIGAMAGGLDLASIPIATRFSFASWATSRCKHRPSRRTLSTAAI